MWLSGFFLDSVSHSWGVPTMEITDLSILCEWETLKNRQCINTYFPHCIYYRYITFMMFYGIFGAWRNKIMHFADLHFSCIEETTLKRTETNQRCVNDWTFSFKWTIPLKADAERLSQSVRVRSFLSFNAHRHQTNQKHLSRRTTDADDQRRMDLFWQAHNERSNLHIINN